jgi:hypothetical protein
MNSQAKTAVMPAIASAASTSKPAIKKPIKRPAAKRPEVSGKLGKLITLLRRPKGATLTDLMKATGWQAHSVRGAISGALKKKLKLAVLSEKTGQVRTYRIRGRA